MILKDHKTKVSHNVGSAREVIKMGKVEMVALLETKQVKEVSWYWVWWCAGFGFVFPHGGGMIIAYAENGALIDIAGNYWLIPGLSLWLFP